MSLQRILAMLPVLLTVISVNAVADTQAFKCTADDGKISYLDTRPATGCVTIEVVRINVGKGSSGDGNEGENPEATDENYDKQLAEKQAQVKKECEAKKTNLNTVKTRAVVQVKGEDGKLKTLSPEEMVQMAKEMQTYIDNFCTK